MARSGIVSGDLLHARIDDGCDTGNRQRRFGDVGGHDDPPAAKTNTGEERQVLRRRVAATRGAGRSRTIGPDRAAPTPSIARLISARRAGSRGCRQRSLRGQVNDGIRDRLAGRVADASMGYKRPGTSTTGQSSEKRRHRAARRASPTSRRSAGRRGRARPAAPARSPRSACMLRSWNSSSTIGPEVARAADPAAAARVRTPSVATSSRVCGRERRSKRTCQPISRPMRPRRVRRRCAARSSAPPRAAAAAGSPGRRRRAPAARASSCPRQAAAVTTTARDRRTTDRRSHRMNGSIGRDSRRS